MSSMWPRADVMNTMKAFSWIAGLTNNRFPVQSKPGAPRERGAGFGRALCSAQSPSIPLMLGLQWSPCRRQVQHGSITCSWCLRAPWKGIQVPGRLIPKCQEGVYVLWDHRFTQGHLGAAQHRHCCSRDGETEARGGGGGMCRVSQSKIQKSPSSGPCITYLPISTISSLISSTEVASCVPGLAQAQDQAGKAAGAEPELLPRPQTPHNPCTFKSEIFVSAALKRISQPLLQKLNLRLNSQTPEHQKCPSLFPLSSQGKGST